MEATAALPLAGLTILGLTGAWLDTRDRILPNRLSLAILVLGLGIAVWAGGVNGALWNLAHCGVALVIGFGLFGLKAWGAGDGKFYAAVAAWFPLDRFFELILAISSVGLVLVIVHVMRNRGRLLSKDNNGLPYGVAIGLGAILVLARSTL